LGTDRRHHQFPLQWDRNSRRLLVSLTQTSDRRLLLLLRLERSPGQFSDANLRLTWQDVGDKVTHWLEVAEAEGLDRAARATTMNVT
jgi:hypothetical protein